MRAESSQTTNVLVTLLGVNVVLNGVPVLNNLTWALHRGENWAVLGPNGAGKSTFLRLLRGEVWPAPVNGGERLYYFDGRPTRSPIGVARRMALVSAEQQQRYLRVHGRKYGDDFTPRMTAAQIVFTGLLGSEVVLHMPSPAERAQVRAALAQVGMAHRADDPFDTLSQGQFRRVLIARALVSKPEVLILDEVGVGLDAKTRRELLDVIQQLAEQGTQILMTTHRRDELIPAVTNVLELKDGHITRIARRAPQPTSASRREDSWQPVERNSKLSQPFVVRLTNVSAAADPHGALVLHGITWQINEGEHWALLGDNGVGKSTLLRVILGELQPARGGQIERFNGADIRSAWAIKQRIGYVSCDLQARYAVDLTAEQVIASGFFASIGWLQPLTKAQRARVAEVIEQFNLQPLAKRSILHLSYGQARRVLLARAIVNKPRLLILDEALDGLDPATRAEFIERLLGLAQTTTLLIATHHEEDLPPCITHRAIMRAGRIVAQERRAPALLLSTSAA
ncbi:MAG: ATP-binding cassette domain-containing protein [Thermoflexales bacterium]|nr:ATP-binding cassette domain-containing protein [Thermoflexales bacterium]